MGRPFIQQLPCLYIPSHNSKPYVTWDILNTADLARATKMERRPLIQGRPPCAPYAPYREQTVEDHSLVTHEDSVGGLDSNELIAVL
jgi:hypothetical protein